MLCFALFKIYTTTALATHIQYINDDVIFQGYTLNNAIDTQK